MDEEQLRALGRADQAAGAFFFFGAAFDRARFFGAPVSAGTFVPASAAPATAGRATATQSAAISSAKAGAATCRARVKPRGGPRS